MIARRHHGVLEKQMRGGASGKVRRAIGDHRLIAGQRLRGMAGIAGAIRPVADGTAGGRQFKPVQPHGGITAIPGAGRNDAHQHLARKFVAAIGPTNRQREGPPRPVGVGDGESA